MHYISFPHIWCHLESDGLRSVGQLETMLYMFLIICGPPGYSRNVLLMVLAEGKTQPNHVSLCFVHIYKHSIG